MRRGDKAWTIVNIPQAFGASGRSFALKEWRVKHKTPAGYVLRVPTARQDVTGPEIKYFPRCMVLDAQQVKEYKLEAAAWDPKKGDLVLVLEQFKHEPLQGIVVSTTKAMADVLMTDGSTGPAWKERRQDGNPLRRCSKTTLVVISRGEAETKVA